MVKRKRTIKVNTWSRINVVPPTSHLLRHALRHTARRQKLVSTCIQGHFAYEEVYNVQQSTWPSPLVGRQAPLLSPQRQMTGSQRKALGSNAESYWPSQRFWRQPRRHMTHLNDPVGDFHWYLFLACSTRTFPLPRFVDLALGAFLPTARISRISPRVMIRSQSTTS